MKGGMASGATASTAQARLPGISVRSTAQAAAVPMTAQQNVVQAISSSVFSSNWPTRDRHNRETPRPTPPPTALATVTASGSSTSPEARQQTASSPAEGRPRDILDETRLLQQ